MIANIIRLGELVKIKTGKLDANAANPDGRYPFFTCAIEPLRIDTAAYNCECVLVAGNGDLNVKYYSGEFNAYQRTYIIESIRKDVLNTKYLSRFLDQSLYILRKNTKGGVIQYIRIGDLTELSIPLPPLSEQIQIAEILTHAETLIAQRKESIRLLDELVKSKFLEMFGDPVKNEKGWEVKRLGDYFVKKPQNGLYKPSNLYGEGTKILRIDSFYNGKISDITYLKRVKVNQSEIEKYGLEKNDIVINRVNSREYLGKCGLVPELIEPVVFESNMMRFSTDLNKFSPFYLNFLLCTQFIRNQINRFAKDAVNQSSINQQDVAKLLVLVPPLELQGRFAEFANQIEFAKNHFQLSLIELESLYTSLSQKAFRGELIFEREIITLGDPKPLESDAAKETKSQPKKRTTKKSQNPKVIELKPTNVDFYKRTVLAAEIVWQLHKESTFGHLKLQKLLYLCIRTSNMQLPVHFSQQTMGPYDPQLMRSIDKQLYEKKWFHYDKDKPLKYEPLGNAGQHQADFQRYYSFEQEGIFFLIKKFRTIKSDTVEIVATLYACLENIMEQKETFSGTLLLKKFYDWSDRKKVFDELEVRKVFKKMRDFGILPKGI